VLEVEDASHLSVDELFKLRFVSNKFDYKARLEERTRFTKLLKERINSQVEHLENRQKEREAHEARLTAAIEELDKQTFQLESELKNATEEKQAAEQVHEGVTAELGKCSDAFANATAVLKEKQVLSEAASSSVNDASARLASAQDELVAAKNNLEQQKVTSTKLQEYNTQLQEYNSKLQDDLNTLQATTLKLQEEKVVAQQQLCTLKAERELAMGQLEVAKATAQSHEASIISLENEVETVKAELAKDQELRSQEESEVAAVQAQVDEYRATHGKTQAEFDRLNTENQQLQQTYSSQSQNLSAMQAEMESTKTRLLMADEASQLKISEFSRLQEALEASQQQVNVLREERTAGEALRRSLNNTILDLKGNIRTFCRLHPAQAAGIVELKTGTTGEQSIELRVPNVPQPFVFGFDKHFPGDFSQAQFFDEVADLVTNAVEGFRVCIASYGSKDTSRHTMIGGRDCDQGIIPRAVRKVIDDVTLLNQKGWTLEVSISMLQICQEAVSDMFSSSQNSIDDQFLSDSANLPSITISSMVEFEKLFQLRNVYQTEGKDLAQMVPGHSMLTIKVSGENATGQQRNGVLSLVTLTANQHGTTDITDMKTCDNSFNGIVDVVYALSTRASAVPYQSSKLAQLMQPFLGSNSKTLMITEIGSDPAASKQNLHILRFGAKVNSCHVGRAKKN